MNSNDFATRHGRFADWTPEEIALLLEEVQLGMAQDFGDRFEGYWGVSTALRIADTYLELGDCPEANQKAVALIGVLARYALDSTHWDDEHLDLRRALEVIENAAAPIVLATGTDWNGAHR
jgi:hypothetical protein